LRKLLTYGRKKFYNVVTWLPERQRDCFRFRQTHEGGKVGGADAGVGLAHQVDVSFPAPI
jgi:hypothetical protein